MLNRWCVVLTVTVTENREAHKLKQSLVLRKRLSKAVKKHVEFFLSQKSSFDEESLQALMPPSLREESVLQIHKVPTLQYRTCRMFAPQVTTIVDNVWE